MSLVKLRKRWSVIFKPESPYNFNATLHKPSHFPSSDNEWQKSNYWITMVWRDKYLGLKFIDKGSVAEPKVTLEVYSKKSLSKNFKQKLKPEIEWRFNFRTDISEFSKKFKNDKVLGPLIKKWRGMKPVAANSLYESLIIYVVLQNARVSRSVQMFENLFEKFGKKITFDGKTLSTFWRPKEINKVPEKTLRDLKLGYRAKFIKKISSQFVKGKINEHKMREMSREKVKEKALQIYGIGPSSVEYLLFEDFYHYCKLEIIPPWEQKILSKLLFDKKKVSSNKILKFFKENYPGWEKLAFHYIWEDVFWKRKNQHINWLEKEIRL